MFSKPGLVKCENKWSTLSTGSNVASAKVSHRCNVCSLRDNTGIANLDGVRMLTIWFVLDCLSVTANGLNAVCIQFVGFQ